MIDLLVVSQSCLTAINRAPYRELARRGWSVEIVVPKAFTSGTFHRQADTRQPTDPPLHTLAIRGDHPRLWTFEGLHKLLNARKPRIILLDVDPGSRLAISVGWWARRHGARTACISCDNAIRGFRAELRRSRKAAARLAAARTLSWVARALVDHVFVLSQDGVRVMQRSGFANKVSLIPLGYDPAVFRRDELARARIRRELGLQTLTFAYFGRLMPEKGVHVLLEALAGLKQHSWQLLLDEFGEYKHPYADELRDVIDRSGLSERIVFFDAPHERVADYMNAADVVVAPSISTDAWKEQYGRVVPEAMACGRLVVVSNCGSLPEVAGDAGIVVRENDVEALREALSAIIADSDICQRYSSRAIEQASRHHSLVIQCERMEERFSPWRSSRRSELPSTKNSTPKYASSS